VQISIKNQNQAGFTLLEILVTSIILAIGLLGIASLQNSSIKLSYDSYIRTQASILSYDLMDRVRANPTATPTQCISTTATCDSTDILDSDLADWYDQATAIFPVGEFSLARVTLAGGNRFAYTLTITWIDRYQNEDKEDANNIAIDDTRSEFVFNFEVEG